MVRRADVVERVTAGAEAPRAREKRPCQARTHGIPAPRGMRFRGTYRAAPPSKLPAGRSRYEWGSAFGGRKSAAFGGEALANFFESQRGKPVKSYVNGTKSSTGDRAWGPVWCPGWSQTASSGRPSDLCVHSLKTDVTSGIRYIRGSSRDVREIPEYTRRAAARTALRRAPDLPVSSELDVCSRGRTRPRGDLPSAYIYLL